MDICRRTPSPAPPLAPAPPTHRAGHGPEDVDDPFAPGNDPFAPGNAPFTLAWNL
ncbi:hypothetical protein [Streptomyces sp. NPDC051000]|uniref:hypothetical protein n=1 Tax=unclassified Streptomyces TaxID=2593676 RepID=UPI0033D7F0F1